MISIHAPRTGSDVFTAHTREGYIISIHAPRTGSDTSKCLLASPASDFNPRSPHGERLCRVVVVQVVHRISIHAPRTGSDVSL